MLRRENPEIEKANEVRLSDGSIRTQARGARLAAGVITDSREHTQTKNKHENERLSLKLKIMSEREK